MEGRILLAGMVGAGVLLVGSVWLLVKEDNHQRDLIASGECQVIDTFFYTPPPTYIKSGDIMIPVQSAGYYKDVWRCSGGYTFDRPSP